MTLSGLRLGPLGFFLGAVLMGALFASAYGCGGGQRETAAGPAATRASAGAEETAEYDADEEAAEEAGDASSIDGAGRVAPSYSGTDAPGAEPAVVDPAIVDHSSELEQLFGRLESSLALGASIDCDEASDLKDRICELAERICRIAGRHPGSVDAQDRCEDGRMRCESAADSVDDRC